MNTKTTINRILSIVLTLAITITLLSYFTGIVEDKSVSIEFDDFYTVNPDVIFLGSSHTMYGVFPLQLWSEYGMAGYNCGIAADYLPSTYWVMENVLDYSSPKLVVIDCYTIGCDFKLSKYSFAHSWLDSLPLSVNKMRAIWDLTDDPERDKAIREQVISTEEDELDEGVKSEFIWDFVKYHSRWSQLEYADFNVKKNNLCGAQSWCRIYPIKYELDANIAPTEIEGIGKDYLYKMIDECKANNIEVLLTYIPFAAGASDVALAEALNQIASEKNVKYINFLEQNVVNYDTDFSDPSHLNYYGQIKVSKYLGKYIDDNYSIPDRRSDAGYEYWEDKYCDYTELLLETLENELCEEEILEILRSDNLVSVVAINDEAFLNNKTACTILGDMGLDVDKIVSYPCYISIKNGRCSQEPSENLSTELKEALSGDFSFKSITTSEYSENVITKEL